MRTWLYSKLTSGSVEYNLLAAVDYRHKLYEAIQSGRWKPVSKQGTVAPISSGIDFKVKLKALDYTRFDVDSIIIKWKVSDKRMIRGPYGSINAKSPVGEGS